MKAEKYTYNTYHKTKSCDDISPSVAELRDFAWGVLRLLTEAMSAFLFCSGIVGMGADVCAGLDKSKLHILDRRNNV